MHFYGDQFHLLLFLPVTRGSFKAQDNGRVNDD